MDRSTRKSLVILALAATPALALGRPMDVEPRGALGKIEASPRQVEIDPAAGLGVAEVSWSNDALAQVWVAVDGGPEALFGCGDEGSQEAPWIQAGHRYDFRLYPGQDCSAGGKLHPRIAQARVIGKGAAVPAALRPAHPSVGANKFDLALQYLGIAAGGDGGPAYLRVEQAMARKSILDARDAGSGFLRVAITGYGPVVAGEKGDLALWLDDPAEYWKRLDAMADDVQKAGLRLAPVFVWNSAQFPSLAGDSVSDLIKDPRAASYSLLLRYVSEFIGRYKGQDVIEFYELTNELNLMADLDSVGRCRREPPSWDPGLRSCEVQGNFSTDEMVGFSTRLAAAIRAQDPTRRISSGYGFPRANADHMRRKPEWLGADWTPDSVQEFQGMLQRTHAGLDIVSVHAYNGGGDNERFGLKGHANAGMIQLAKDAADASDQLLFVGEVGDQDPDLRADPRSPFTSAVLSSVVRLGVAYAAPWVWEFYQASLFIAPGEDDFAFHLEPGFSDALIDTIRAANAAMGHPAPRLSAEEAKPRVVLTWPLDHAWIKGRQAVYAAASAAGARKIARVELWGDDTLYETLDRPPFSFALDVDRLKEFPARLAVRAYDEDGAMAEDSVPVFDRALSWAN